jgi:hypothetical protein
MLALFVFSIREVGGELLSVGHKMQMKVSE